jgi:hypothetical protein
MSEYKDRGKAERPRIGADILGKMLKGAFYAEVAGLSREYETAGHPPLRRFAEAGPSGDWTWAELAHFRHPCDACQNTLAIQWSFACPDEPILKDSLTQPFVFRKALDRHLETCGECRARRRSMEAAAFDAAVAVLACAADGLIPQHRLAVAFRAADGWRSSLADVLGFEVTSERLFLLFRPEDPIPTGGDPQLTLIDSQGALLIDTKAERTPDGSLCVTASLVQDMESYRRLQACQGLRCEGPLPFRAIVRDSRGAWDAGDMPPGIVLRSGCVRSWACV